MKLKLILLSVISLIVFLALIFFNYLKAQQAIRETKVSPLSLELVSYPATLKTGERGTFIWRVISSPDLSTEFTTLYWGPTSSPSAVTTHDSPQALGYPHFTNDYTQGLFKLPDQFDIELVFDHPGRIYFRAYSQVKNDHLWSAEKYVDILP